MNQYTKVDQFPRGKHPSHTPVLVLDRDI